MDLTKYSLEELDLIIEQARMERESRKKELAEEYCDKFRALINKASEDGFCVAVKGNGINPNVNITIIGSDIVLEDESEWC